MFQKAMDIVRARWPEVALIVVLQAAMMFLYDELVQIMADADAGAALLPFWVGFLLGIGAMAMFIVWLMLYLGFLKTAALEGAKGVPPEQLIRYGRPYFWRYLFFNLLIGGVMFLLTGMVVGLFASTVWKGRPIETIPQWLMQVCALGVLLGLIKPMLFIPARILVYDNTTLEALFSVGRYRMGQIHGLNQSIGAGFLAILPAAIVYTLLPEGTAVHYVFLGVHHLLFAMVPLFLTLLVVLWVQDEYNTVQTEQAEKESDL